MILWHKYRYFPYDIQILKTMWDDLGLGEVRSELLSHGSLPKILFFRRLALRMNSQPQFQNKPVPAGLLNLYAVITDIYRHLMDEYLEVRHPALLAERLKAAGFDFNAPAVVGTIKKFVEFFPGTPILDGKESSAEFIKNDDKNHSRKKMVAKELLLLRVAEYNAAVDKFRPLLDTTELSKKSQYKKLVTILEREFKKSPVFNPFNLTLMDMLLEPVKASPDSLTGQIEYIKRNWGIVLPEELLDELTVALDIVKEEEREWWGGAGPPVVLEFDKTARKTLYDYDYPEYERFTPDTDWMSNVVLMAKMIHVWLRQLSKKYGHAIARLDQIPDEELDLLSRWGVTGLWLIGAWERSPASKKIKHLSGNIDALASAYSLYDYVVAGDLGGESALDNLRERALKRGIRLASDMVPNHTGIYSKWTLEHPDWFIQLDYSPYPSYRFTGEDLSFSPNISLYLEDGYRTKTDAAVVFKYVDNRTYRTRYIYHGNDGTSTPWNDTAQLNYLLPEVREAVIQTILHVARKFSIIRFDAAMTLAKKHYERLWYPLPGYGGGIPSRAEHGMTRRKFDEVFPKEFWREVVDRVTAEAPDTLLLAEAFWLMEGYFVRTLGMHRVYNSAFMNMLKLEENAKYRRTIKNVMEFNPEILKRFVNFMNNPDEETAAAQFGKGGKYIGVALMMVTMPGMPMLGHGQIEGFTEKYGMEYQRHYWDEIPDEALIRAHETKIFPLMKKRYLFSASDNFALYDFFSGDHVNEDVFAYSNRFGHERALIVYHNKFASVSGWVRMSVSFMVKQQNGEESLKQKTLGEAMGFNQGGRVYYIFKDYVSGLEYVRNGEELCRKGMYVELEAYDCHAFLDFVEIYDDEFGNWGRFCFRLAGRPVPDIQEEFKQVKFENVILPLSDILTAWPDTLRDFFAPRKPEYDGLKTAKDLLAGQQQIFLSAVSEHLGVHKDLAPAWESMFGRLELFAALLAEETDDKASNEALRYLKSNSENDYSPVFYLILSAYAALRNAGSIVNENRPANSAVSLIEDFSLGRMIKSAFERKLSKESLSSMDASTGLSLITILLKCDALFSVSEKEVFTCNFCALMNDTIVKKFLLVNEYDNRSWFNKERFEEMLFWIFTTAALEITAHSKLTPETLGKISEVHKAVVNLLEAAAETSYCFDAFLINTQRLDIDNLAYQNG